MTYSPSPPPRGQDLWGETFGGQGETVRVRLLGARLSGQELECSRGENRGTFRARIRVLSRRELGNCRGENWATVLARIEALSGRECVHCRGESGEREMSLLGFRSTVLYRR